MKAKKFLEEYRKAGSRVIRIAAEIDELRTQAAMPGHGCTGVVIQAAPKSRLDEIVPKIIEETNKLEKELTEAQEIRKQVRQAIASVKEDKHREVLSYIYMCGYTVEQTAEMIQCDPRTVYRRRNNALLNIKIPKD